MIHLVNNHLLLRQEKESNNVEPDNESSDAIVPPTHCVKSVQIRSYFWSVFSRIRTEYGDILHISPYSVRMRENTDQK